MKNSAILSIPEDRRVEALQSLNLMKTTINDLKVIGQTWIGREPQGKVKAELVADMIDELIKIRASKSAANKEGSTSDKKEIKKAYEVSPKIKEITIRIIDEMIESDKKYNAAYFSQLQKNEDIKSFISESGISPREFFGLVLKDVPRLYIGKEGTRTFYIVKNTKEMITKWRSQFDDEEYKLTYAESQENENSDTEKIQEEMAQ